MQVDSFSIPTHQLKRFRLGISLLWPLTDLAEGVTCVPPGVVWSDHISPVVEGTEPHLSVAVSRRKKQKTVMIDCCCAIQIGWCRDTHASVRPNRSPFRFHALTMVTSSVPLWASLGQQLEARLGADEQDGSLVGFIMPLSCRYCSMAAFIPSLFTFDGTSS